MTEVFNIDCMEAMAQMKDNEFSLSIVDPPYGLGWTWKNPGRLSVSNHKKKDWNNKIPPPEYFEQLFRVSENQIIWGGNYFTDHLPAVRGWIAWKKFTEKAVYCDIELAWSSFDRVASLFEYRWNGMLQGDIGDKKKNETRIHPTQKPVALYKWLLKNYAKEGDRILDTHLGSGSSRIAAHDMGFDFVGHEIDIDYFEAQEKRFKHHIQQKSLFQPNEMYHG